MLLKVCNFNCSNSLHWNQLSIQKEKRDKKKKGQDRNNDEDSDEEVEDLEEVPESEKDRITRVALSIIRSVIYSVFFLVHIIFDRILFYLNN